MWNCIFQGIVEGLWFIEYAKYHSYWMCYLASLNLILPLSANPANGETQPNFVNFEEVIADWVGVEFYRIISNKNFYFCLFQTVVSIFPWFSISDEPASQKIKKSGSGEKKVVNSKENALESRERFVNTYEKTSSVCYCQWFLYTA